jgi:hypothetical protein
VPVTQEHRTALALAALSEVTDPDDVGELIAVEEVEPGVVDVRFGCTLAAYAGWHWTVSTADLPDQEPTVLEVELLPGDGALLAPPWVPWTERLAEWRRQHPDEHPPGEPVDDADEADDAEHDDEADLDEDDLAIDDGIDELDETELENEEGPEAAAQDPGDDSDEDDDSDGEVGSEDDDDFGPSDGHDHDSDHDSDDDGSSVRPAMEDRSL